MAGVQEKQGRIVVVIGPPCAGKGTLCKLLAQKEGLIHLSTGDLFRDHVARGTELGLQAKEYLDRGDFVPDNMVLNLVRDRLSEPDIRQHGCLLDGFPRNADQAEALTKNISVHTVILLQVEKDDTLVKRALKRRLDPETGEIYNLGFEYLMPPPDVEARMVSREYDNDAHRFQVRIDSFRMFIKRVLPFFRGRVQQISALHRPEKVCEAALRALQGAVEASAESVPEKFDRCAVCFDEPANVVVVPCGHLCTCEECMAQLQKTTNKCPICRVQINRAQRVFPCGYDESSKGVALGSSRVGEAAAPHKPLEEVLDPQKGMVDDDDDWPEDIDEDEAMAPEVPTLEVALHQQVPDAGGEANVVVTINSPACEKRTPADICCVVDISGSMSSLATYEVDGVVKNDGLSILDLVKHAVRTVMHVLGEDDRLSLVAFNTKAKTVFDLGAMSADGRTRAMAALEALQPNDQTNIWAGILAGMESLPKGRAATGRQQSLLLLTDGMPNVLPPKGHITELENYKDMHKDFSFQMNTFGFGYSLDSELLLDLAVAGRGTYAFIPDAVILGTVFVNSVANVLSTHTQDAILHLSVQQEAKFTAPVLGNLPVAEESWGRVVSLGPLQHASSRDVVVPMHLPAGSEAFLEATLEYPALDGAQVKTSVLAAARCATETAAVGSLRSDTVSVGYAAVRAAASRQGQQAQTAVEALVNRILLDEARSRSSTGTGDADGRLLALKADVEGRMTKALQGEKRFNRWGKHYLRALMRAHQLQLCTNFMDPGLQLYGGPEFKALRDAGDTIFLSLPPPKPSKPARVGGVKRKRTPSPDMRTYHAGRLGGCFGEDSTVRVVLADGSERSVSVGAVRLGDTVRVADGVARVRCLVSIARSPRKALVALPGGLTITARHPIRVDGQWRLPFQEACHGLASNLGGRVYNFVLDRCHVLLVNSIECATWGHGIKEPVVQHPFYGTSRVVQNLMSLPGWEQGFVQVEGCFRDAANQVVRLHGIDCDVHPDSEMKLCINKEAMPSATLVEAY